MRDRIKAGVRKIVIDHTVEARWLNMLSFMEFVGARKIGKTVAQEHPPVAILQHFADEARHASTFKSLAVDLVVGEPDGYLCRDAASDYFQRLDRELSAWATEIVGEEHTSLNYLLVTAMSIRRALSTYGVYLNATPHEFIRDALRPIVTEEQQHLARIEGDCVRLLTEYGIKDLNAPSAVESAYFDQFWSAIEAELGIESEDTLSPAA